MSAVDDILSQIPLSQLASRLGTDEQTAESATRSALPALLGNLQAGAQDPAQAASLDQAVGQHSPSLIEGGVNLDDVDDNQGHQVLGQMFGGNAGGIANQIAGGQGGPSPDLVQRLLPLLAPIVMSYLAKRMGGGAGGAAGGLGGVLGSVLGGGGTGGGLGGALGGLLGGDRR